MHPDPGSLGAVRNTSSKCHISTSLLHLYDGLVSKLRSFKSKFHTSDHSLYQARLPSSNRSHYCTKLSTGDLQIDIVQPEDLSLPFQELFLIVGWAGFLWRGILDCFVVLRAAIYGVSDTFCCLQISTLLLGSFQRLVPSLSNPTSETGGGIAFSWRFVG